MGFFHWLKPPGRTLALFLCLILVLGSALGWLGWQFIKQDRALENLRRQERLELTADQMAAALQQNITDLEKYLNFVPGSEIEELPNDVVVLNGTKRTVITSPPGRLLFYSVIENDEEPPSEAFAPGEILEFQHNNPAGAAIKTETVDGNLKSAIEQHRKIAEMPAAGRATVATALGLGTSGPFQSLGESSRENRSC